MGGDAANSPLEPTQTQISPHSHRRPAGRRRSLHHHFPVGLRVEVQTNEEDFKGVYFSATVLDPPKSPKKNGRRKSRKLYVEYQNLLAHEDGSDRLREFVDVAFVRPAPLVQEIVKGFEPDDVVDAFYKDGWWTGVVTRVVDGGERFVVTFLNPPDELEFGLGELRAHWDWVNGAWVRPQRQSIAGLMFDVGRKVEVSFEREDSQDAWYPATIHEDLGDGTFLVESSSAKTDNRSLAKARVDSLHIRPCPPLLKAKNFVLLEKVDAFFDSGWWSGIITKHLENSRYVVFFKQMKYDKEFSQSELRPHMEWKEGKWFTSSQEPSIPSLDDKVCQNHKPADTNASLATAPVSNSVNGGDTYFGKTHSSLISTNDHFEQFIPDNQESCHATTSLTKKRGYLSDSGGALSQPLKKLREEENVGANADDGDVEIISLCSLESPESLGNVETSVAQTTMDDSSSKHPWEKNVQRKQRNSRKNSSENIKSTSNFLRKSTAQVLLELDFEEKEPETAGNTEEGTQHEHARRETGLPVVIGLPCPEPRSSGVSGSNRSRPSDKKVLIGVDDQKQQIYDFTGQTIKDVDQSGMGEVSEKRKRGRPKRIPVERIETLSIGNPGHGSHSSGDLNKKDDDSQRIHEVVMIGMEASTSNQDQTMPDQDKVMLNKEKTMLNQEKMDPIQEKKEMVRNQEKMVPNLEQMSQNQKKMAPDQKKAPYQEKTVLNQKKTTPYQEKATPNHKRTMSYQEKTASILNKTAPNLKKTDQNQKNTASVQEKTVPDPGKTVPDLEKTVPDPEKTTSDLEKTTPDLEKTMLNQEKTMPKQSGPKKRKVRMTKRILAGNHDETGVEESVRLGENSSPKRERKQIPNGRIAVKVREFHGASGGKVTLINHKVHEEKVHEPSNEFDNEPLSKWIEEIHMSSATDGSTGLPPGDTVAQHIVNQASEKQPESERQSFNLVDKGHLASTEPQSLPSEKNSANIVLDEGTQKQSESGTQTPMLVDKVSVVGSEPPSMANVEETPLVLLNQNSEKRSENKAQATAAVCKNPMVLSQPQSSVKTTVDAVLNKENEKRPENGTTLSPTLVDNISTVASEPENLPFMKNTVLWKTIESMEVFQRLPQKPHFQPLLDFKESSREGLAIGYMVTFSSLVERASKLQLNDPVTVMDDIKETLTDLEKYGFTVGPIKDSVDELVAIKEKEGKLVDDAQTLNSKIKERSEVKTRMEREMEEINGHIQKLKKKLSEVESTKEREDEEIAFLQVRLRETEDGIKDLKNGFKGTVSSIL